MMEMLMLTELPHPIVWVRMQKHEGPQIYTPALTDRLTTLGAPRIATILVFFSVLSALAPAALLAAQKGLSARAAAARTHYRQAG
mmetsp:Transcript_84310/g.139557  ORF Transcript_84310/g.139557 Transcript_84310/m.139557 type:complete len:85 (+) Transcript_84310:2-256(+)